MLFPLLPQKALIQASLLRCESLLNYQRCFVNECPVQEVFKIIPTQDCPKISTGVTTHRPTEENVGICRCYAKNRTEVSGTIGHLAGGIYDRECAVSVGITTPCLTIRSCAPRVPDWLAGRCPGLMLIIGVGEGVGIVVGEGVTIVCMASATLFANSSVNQIRFCESTFNPS